MEKGRKKPLVRGSTDKRGEKGSSFREGRSHLLHKKHPQKTWYWYGVSAANKPLGGSDKRRVRVHPRLKEGTRCVRESCISKPGWIQAALPTWAAAAAVGGGEPRFPQPGECGAMGGENNSSARCPPTAVLSGPAGLEKARPGPGHLLRGARVRRPREGPTCPRGASCRGRKGAGAGGPG